MLLLHVFTILLLHVMVAHIQRQNTTESQNRTGLECHKEKEGCGLHALLVAFSWQDVDLDRSVVGFNSARLML